MANDGDWRIMLLLANGFDQPGQAVGGQHEIRAGRAAEHLPFRERIQMLDFVPQEKSVIQAILPQIRQRAAAIGERPAAPIILLVQIDALAVLLQFLAAGLVAPAKPNHRRKGSRIVDQGVGRHFRIEKAVLRDFGAVADCLQLSPLHAKVLQMVAGTLEALVEAAAQAVLRRLVPLAIGVDAVDKNDNAGQR
ncbi:hypothetical protein D3C81_562370 [compost metagenome]